jgi:hypothetical protein
MNLSTSWKSLVAGMMLWLPFAAQAQHFDGGEGARICAPVCGHWPALAHQPRACES